MSRSHWSVAVVALLFVCMATAAHVRTVGREFFPAHLGTKGLARAAQTHRLKFAEHGTTFQKEGFPGAANCTTHWFTQYIDHFSFGQPSGAAEGEMTYQQRYLTFDKYYKPGGPIFFYTGNELNIEVFANIAGLMWQNAEAFNAALVFAEHRFFGESQPCNGSLKCFPHLSTMQAMADYAILLTNLTTVGKYKDSKGIITFGGSYGGMLSAWMRIKYPNLITGSIAASGPIGMVSSAYRRSSYWQVITRDATSAGGAAPNCSWNVYTAIQHVFKLLKTEEGRATVAQTFKTCSNISSEDGKSQMGYFIQAAFDLLGMGDYPVPLNFIFGTVEKPAPAWPMRAACNLIPGGTDGELVQQLANAVNMVYNITEDVVCNNIDVNPTTGEHWDYMVCSEGIINELPYFEAEGWPNDMFYPQPRWTHERFDEHCSKKFGLTTRWNWLNTSFGAGNVEGATNIVFSNGLLDPWHSGGILHNVSSTVRSYIIPMGAHHLDLLFTSPADPPEVHFVRSEELRHIRMWLAGK